MVFGSVGGRFFLFSWYSMSFKEIENSSTFFCLDSSRYAAPLSSPSLSAFLRESA